MVQIYQLDLPGPSLEFLQTIAQGIQSFDFDVSGKQWLDQQNQTTNSADYLFFKQQQVDEFVAKEFGQFFRVPVGGIVGVMKNTGPDHANHPPHIDSVRSLAINYYVDLGGDAVDTTFYDVVEQTDGQSKNYPYKQVQDRKIGSVNFQKGCWYAYDVCRCHSVENITGTRNFISIVINDPCYRVQAFAQDYPELIRKQIVLHK
jgi:hypothetical protein